MISGSNVTSGGKILTAKVRTNFCTSNSGSTIDVSVDNTVRKCQFAICNSGRSANVSVDNATGKSKFAIRNGRRTINICVNDYITGNGSHSSIGDCHITTNSSASWHTTCIANKNIGAS